MKTRKTYTMLVTVTAPRDMPAAAIRREIRSLIRYQSNWDAAPDDVKVASIRGIASSAGGGTAAIVKAEEA